MSMPLKNLLSSLGLIIMYQCLLSCTGGTCKLPNGNTTSELLINVANERNYNYCEILKSALKGDGSSVRKLALLSFTDAAGYDHGAVLIEVIEQIGVKEFKNAIIDSSKEQKELIESYLDVGLMYGFRKEYQDKSLKMVYPDIYSFLNKN